MVKRNKFQWKNKTYMHVQCTMYNTKRAFNNKRVISFELNVIAMSVIWCVWCILYCSGSMLCLCLSITFYWLNKIESDKSLNINAYLITNIIVDLHVSLHVLVTLELFSLELQLQIAAVDNTATEYIVCVYRNMEKMLEVAGQKMFVIQSSLNLPCGAEKANQAIHRSTQIAFFFNWIFSLAASKLDYAKCVYSVAGSHL